MKLRNLIILLLSAFMLQAYADDSDWGMQFGAEASHKINKKLSASAEASIRSRNNFQTVDRWTAGVDITYKALKYLKFSAGYVLLEDNNIEKITYNASGEVKKWRPSYWGFRHRFTASATGSYSVDRLSLSLRERWQYTYRPQKVVDRYDFMDGAWEDKVMDSTHRQLLRSRLQVEYDIPKCKLDPYASVELFNSMRLQKTRFILGLEWKLNKKNSFELYYRYQIVNRDDNDETNSHIIGIDYKIKF